MTHHHHNHSDDDRHDRYVASYDHDILEGHDHGSVHHHHETHDEAILYHQHVDSPDHGHEWVTAVYNNGGGNFDHDVDYFGPADHTHHDE